ncbi:hypothetical protein [Mucilaginibacter gotjawali]|uniref:Uncharacterized protein n=2 Tax=Mucilaginibacter gotjawali TaxID=1550579 RepID=A0A110B460_9SPHI|nr:hypothetical protein [Mucilaginibacter gotjawali]MBB3057322.1 hypothetical protein [Mucilaginibacter gotjawali]BAU52912.1 hypothetical protein MgSA37_01076 [Mucilaginibacter gotjawali]
MKIQEQKIYQLMGVIALFVISMGVSTYINALNKAELHKTRQAEFGNLVFKGKVIHVRFYEFMKSKCYQVCVKLDSAGVKDFSVYNDDDAIKIKDGIATFAAGHLDKTFGPVDSVAVNVNHSGKVFLYYRDKSFIKFDDFSFEHFGMKKSDLNFCF